MIARRDFLRGAAAAALLGPRALRAQDGDPAYAGFKMGMQTYSLRAFDLDQTLAHLKDLGLKYAQFFGGRQMTVTDDAATLELYRKKLADAGVRILSFGVQGFGANAGANKKSFDFAKALGFDVIVANPSPDSFDNVAGLCKDYGMKIAIHNHGPEDKRYGKLEQLQKALEKYPEAMGVCVDTGHVLRIGEDPIAWIKAFGPRVHDVHLKDASAPNVFNILGQGKIDLVGTLKALKDVKFSGILAIEYELNEKNPIDDIRKCLEATREACKKL
jgi:sugar phosphate isomerase/epimerase